MWENVLQTNVPFLTFLTMQKYASSEQADIQNLGFLTKIFLIINKGICSGSELKVSKR
jgi:hypothetical protein